MSNVMKIPIMVATIYDCDSFYLRYYPASGKIDILKRLDDSESVLTTTIDELEATLKVLKGESVEEKTTETKPARKPGEFRVGDKVRVVRALDLDDELSAVINKVGVVTAVYRDDLDPKYTTYDVEIDGFVYVAWPNELELVEEASS